MSKGYKVDSTNQTVTVVTFNNITELHNHIGGYLEVAFAYPNGDVLYVDEEGMLKGNMYGFGLVERPDQPLVGNGVLVGRERVGPYPGGYTNLDPGMTIEQFRAKVLRWYIGSL